MPCALAAAVQTLPACAYCHIVGPIREPHLWLPAGTIHVFALIVLLRNLPQEGDQRSTDEHRHRHEIKDRLVDAGAKQRSDDEWPGDTPKRPRPSAQPTPVDLSAGG